MRNLFMVGMSFVVIGSFAQPLKNFDELVAYAYQHSPNIKNSNLEVEKEKLNLNQIGQLNPLQVSYQGGQFNDDTYDNNITINQDLSTLFTKKSQKNQINSRVKSLSNLTDLLKLDLKYRLAVLYQNYLYEEEVSREWKKIEKEFKEIKEKINTKYANNKDGGSIQHFLSKELFEIKNKKTLSELEVSNLKAEIKYVAYLKDSTQIPKGTFEELSVAIEPDDEMTTLSKRQKELEIQSIDLQKKLNASQGSAPSVSAGAFTQSITQQWFFSGFTVGIGIPLDKRVAKYQNRQLDIEKTQIENEFEVFENLVAEESTLNTHKIQKLHLLIQQYQEEFKKDKSIDANELYKELIENTIDFSLFVDSYTNYITLKMDYLSLINEYNLAVIRYEYYSQK